MTDLAFMDPPIMVAAASPRLDMIMSRLRAAGMRPYAMDGGLSGAEPIFVDTQSAPPDLFPALERLAAAGDARPIVVLRRPSATLPPAGAIILRHDVEIPSVPSRLASLRRRTLLQDEIQLRNETLRQLGFKPRDGVNPPPPKLLYLGDGSPFFLELQAALHAEAVTVTAALSAHTALDYLAQSRFSALLIDVSASASEAMRLIELCDDNPAMVGLPILACLRRPAELTDREQKTLGAATEILDASETVAMTANRIAVLAYRYASTRPSQAGDAQDPAIHDRATGWFTRRFFEAHLGRQLLACDQSAQPLSLLALRLRSEVRDADAARDTLPRLAGIVGGTLRQTDCGARYDWTTLAVTLRNTPYSAAAKMAARVAQAGGAVLPDGVSIQWRVVERRAYHTADALISAAMAGPYSRILAA